MGLLRARRDGDPWKDCGEKPATGEANPEKQYGTGQRKRAGISHVPTPTTGRAPGLRQPGSRAIVPRTMAAFSPPSAGHPITMGAGHTLNVPDDPFVPFIEGDGTGRDIWRASVRVLDAAVAKAYDGKKKIA